MTYYEEDQPKLDTSDRFGQRSMEEIKEALGESGPVSGGFLRDPDLVAVEKRVNGIENNHNDLMEMLGGIFVQLSRIYDVLLTQSEYREAIDEKHSKGELFASPPNLKEDAWNVQEKE